MSQSKLQVFTEDANPVLESFFNTLLGQETTFKLDSASETTLDQIKTDAATSFSIVGTPEDAESFVVQLESDWIPIISNAMVGREMAPDEEGVFDLAGQIISQSYTALQQEHARCAAFPTLEVTPFAPNAWEPEETFQENFWRLPFELAIGEQTLSGSLFLSSSLVEGLEEIKNAPAEGDANEDLVQENQVEQDAIGVSTPKFPDFGREHLQQEGPGNFDLLAEVELNVTVELGRRKIPLSEVLKLTTGSVIELEKLVGEPLEIFANGRLIAEGEAVVIEEQFGIRITNLASNKIRAKAFA